MHIQTVLILPSFISGNVVKTILLGSLASLMFMLINRCRSKRNKKCCGLLERKLNLCVVFFLNWLIRLKTGFLFSNFLFFFPYFMFSRKQPLLTFFENNCHLIYACKEGILAEQKIKTTSWLMVHRVSFGPGPKPFKRKATLK